MQKTPSKRSFLGFIGVNLALAIVLFLLGLTVVVVWLKAYTHHGVEVEVPQITGLYYEEAQVLLGSNHLGLEVVDSTYSDKVPLGTIVEQIPAAGSHAKEDRVVYAVLNASHRRQVTLPEVHDISYRQATGLLKQVGLTVADVLYEPSEYKDLVLDVRRCGANDTVSLETGDKLSEGTSVVLVVGLGQGTEMVSVPDLRGLKIANVRSQLLTQHLTLKSYIYDEAPTEENKDDFMVYYQEPAPGTAILEGSGVVIKLSTDPEKAITEDNLNEEEEFF